MFLYLILKSSKYDVGQILKVIEKEKLINEIDMLGVELIKLRQEVGKHAPVLAKIYALPSTAQNLRTAEEQVNAPL